ncbi:unnamed protein product [Linum trigynum]|uniref:Uncharacterized protein n=1 Tax=Linum trigynum TaxID=586398 RepID=A0AAV2FRA6_9ROSI
MMPARAIPKPRQTRLTPFRPPTQTTRSTSAASSICCAEPIPAADLGLASRETTSPSSISFVGNSTRRGVCQRASGLFVGNSSNFPVASRPLSTLQPQVILSLFQSTSPLVPAPEAGNIMMVQIALPLFWNVILLFNLAIRSFGEYSIL